MSALVIVPSNISEESTLLPSNETLPLNLASATVPEVRLEALRLDRSTVVPAPPVVAVVVEAGVQPLAVHTVIVLIVRPLEDSEVLPPDTNRPPEACISPATCKSASPVGAAPIPSLPLIVVSKFKFIWLSLAEISPSSVVDD